MLEVDREANSCLVQIRIAEGKFHQVKRMVAACGKEVTDLERISHGAIESRSKFRAWGLETAE